MCLIYWRDCEMKKKSYLWHLAAILALWVAASSYEGYIEEGMKGQCLRGEEGSCWKGK